MRAMILILSVFILMDFSSANTYDCSSTGSRDERTIDITETDPVNSVLATFNNSYADLRWEASFNGSSKSYLSLFFESSTVEGTDHMYVLKLEKILDLELLQLELVSSAELFNDGSGSSVTLDLSVICGQESGQTNEWDFKINVRPVNEFYPQFMGSPFKATVSESAAIGTEIFNIGQKATDLDAGQTNLTYSIAPYMITQFDGSGYVALDEGKSGSIVLSRPLDFESFLKTGRTYMFVNVTATDEGGFTSATSINVTVTDSNDQGIHLVYPGCERPCLAANYSVLTNESYVGPLDVGPVTIRAEDLDTLNDSVVYTLVSDIDKEFFDIDETTAMLFKIAPLVNDSYGYMIQIEVRAQETTDEDHFIDFNVTISVSERFPKPDFPSYWNKNDDQHRMIERLNVLEKQQLDSQLKIESLEQTVRSQEKQIASQSREIKALEFIVHKHKARVQEVYRKSRLNSKRMFEMRAVLINAGLIKKKNAEIKESPPTDVVQRVQSLESNMPKAADAEDEVKYPVSMDADDINHGTQHQRKSRITRRNMTGNERLADGKRQGSEGIAFSVYLDHDVDLGTHQTIKFNQIISNEGNGYNTHSGVFTCPEAGMYMFSFFVGQRDETVPRGILAELMVNSKNVLDTVVDSFSPEMDITGGNVAMIRLKQGDVVWVDCRGGGSHAEGSPVTKLTSFSGVRLYP